MPATLSPFIFLGSSPLMRGIRTELHDQPPNPKDHPRSCGEYLYSSQVFWPVAGSSPLMRGIQEYYADDIQTMRIIPAHAGNTASFFHCSSPAGDHPRSCGEYPSSSLKFFDKIGSSPLMRGILVT